MGSLRNPVSRSRWARLFAIGTVLLVGVAAAAAITATAGRAAGGPILQVSGPVVFEFVSVGKESEPKSAVISNVGSGQLNITDVQIYAGATDFRIVGDECMGHSLSQGQSCDVKVVFDPQAAGTRVGSLAISDSRGSCLNFIVLAGSGEKTSSPAVARTADCEVTDAPTISNPTTTSSPATTTGATNSVPPKPQVLSPARLKATALCALSKRQIQIHLKITGNEAGAISTARVYLDGHLKSTARGHNLQAVTVGLRGTLASRYGVRVTAVTAQHKTYSTQRFFVACVRRRGDKL